MTNEKQSTKMRSSRGFIAALDQSGGSTPKTLSLYGIGPDAYSGEAEMYDLMHAMRSRIIVSPAFNGDRVIGAILFEMTMDRTINGVSAAQYLWEMKGVVPFLKIDRGLLEFADGVQLMKPMPGLDALLKRAIPNGIFGTKERSVIGAANPTGIAAVVAQQFDVGRQVLSYGLMPILEPEVTISIPDKAEAEDILLAELLKGLEALPEGQEVMLKLSLPTRDNQYRSLVEHPKVMRVVALSGGYSREEANAILARNAGVIASFSRSLSEGLSAQQTDAEFNVTLDMAIQSTFDASV